MAQDFRAAELKASRRTLGMKRVLLGAVGVLVLQALLVWGYLAVNKQDPIVLNPDRGDWSKTAS